MVKLITIETNVKVPVAKAWIFWTEPKHIVHWNHASDDWHTTKAENDLRVGGKFSSRMEAKDGSMGFDFEGIYSKVEIHKLITYELGDGRAVSVKFENLDKSTRVIETFGAENTHTLEQQRSGWQAILDNYKNYAEANYKQ